jgi:hypothetical protein
MFGIHNNYETKKYNIFNLPSFSNIILFNVTIDSPKSILNWKVN